MWHGNFHWFVVGVKKFLVEFTIFGNGKIKHNAVVRVTIFFFSVYEITSLKFFLVPFFLVISWNSMRIFRNKRSWPLGFLQESLLGFTQMSQFLLEFPLGFFQEFFQESKLIKNIILGFNYASCWTSRKSCYWDSPRFFFRNSYRSSFSECSSSECPKEILSRLFYENSTD